MTWSASQTVWNPSASACSTSGPYSCGGRPNSWMENGILNATGCALEEVGPVEAAVHGDHRAGQVRRLLGAQEGDRGGELVVPADPPQVHVGVHLRLAPLRAPGEGRVADDDAVAGHAPAGGLLRDRGHERREAGLCRRVPGS